MRYITEQELRDTLTGGAKQTYAIPSGAKLTPAAREYLADLRIRPVAAESAPAAVGKAAPPGTGVKPEHMTHLTPGELVSKTHPRIALRGKLDSLEAEILVLQVAAGERGETALIAPLNDALQLTRRVLGCEVTGKPLKDWTLDGMSPKTVHDASHRPQDFGFSGHVLPDSAQGWAAAQCNPLRALCREAELAANVAFLGGGNGCERVDLVLALNRLSSFFYILQLQAIRRRG
mgnify:CR=1 FL=1